MMIEPAMYWIVFALCVNTAAIKTINYSMGDKNG